VFSTLVVNFVCQVVTYTEPMPPADETFEAGSAARTVTVGAYAQMPACGYTNELSLTAAVGSLPACISVGPGTHDITISCSSSSDVGSYQVLVTSTITSVD